MRILFSIDYKGGMAYLCMKKQSVMMDTQVVDTDKLLDFLELRLGLHTNIMSESDRLVAYYKCVRDYMSKHKDDIDNQLYGSYKVSPLAVSREMLKWRDALAVCGWTKDTPAPSRRMKVLQGVECLYAQMVKSDNPIRLRNIIDKLRRKQMLLEDITFVLPYDTSLLHPVIREIFTLAEMNGAVIERLAVPEIEGESNLSKLKRLLAAEHELQRITLNADDDTVRIWNFKDDMQAEEYLAMLQDDAFDVIIQPDTKLTDNYLRMMGKPVTGSTVGNSAPQIIQLFFTGVAIMARPLNIESLMQWLYAPMSPLPGKLRYRLAERLALTGGWCDKSVDDDANTCRQMLHDWIMGKAETEAGVPIDKKEQKKRQHLADVFLPDFNGGTKNTLTTEKLHTFLSELTVWAKQFTAMLAAEDENDQRIEQCMHLAELCTTLINLTDDYTSDSIIPYAEIEKHMACLYEPSEFVQCRAQATARLVIDMPGQMAAEADRVLWAGLYNYEPMHTDTDFLTPSEVDVLQQHIQLWGKDDARKLQQTTMLFPLMFCQQQITFVTLDSIGGASLNKHPLIVRIEQQVKNHSDITSTPVIADEAHTTTTKLTDNACCNCDGTYAVIERTDLIKWREYESPTSIDKLMQNPIDYVLEKIANISDNGQSTLSNIAATKGNVAHAVIQQLFLTDEPRSGYPEVIKQRVAECYDTVFDNVVESKGAILLLEENTIERRQLYGQLHECIGNLLDIIEQNRLHVLACEMPLDGNILGASDEQSLEMHGFADMVLARENGERIVFDFKWTGSKHYYQGLLRDNRSSQLAIYADLLKEKISSSRGGQMGATAYFLMPAGRLFSTADFKSRYANKVEIEDSSKADIISQIAASYHYRRKEIIAGRIEMNEGLSAKHTDYYNDTDEYDLFPMKVTSNKDDVIKDMNDFSNYKMLKI